jgi:hypothetical protein
MRSTVERQSEAAEKVVRDIRRATPTAIYRGGKGPHCDRGTAGRGKHCRTVPQGRD